MDKTLLRRYNSQKDNMSITDKFWSPRILKEMNDNEIKEEIFFYQSLFIYYIDEEYCKTYIFILTDVLNKRRINKINKIFNG